MGCVCAKAGGRSCRLGDGVAGAEDIQESLKVQWLDGKELGIAEEEIEARKIEFRMASEIFLAIDAFFEPAKLDERQRVESPGFTGVLRVLGSLVGSDLYAMAVAETQGPADLWPLAMHHPKQVYVGPTVKLQRERWKA
ncbi:hypothetical protein VTN00DRAFT_9281 [Thermoascus crustaceus]|uniref:uncharacterized protein n=1 Tax=Thermoascus crustaceus TaxID=5088 RepID=UPI0037440D73